ncbi:MAG: DM13 domain-containing protein [Litorimonas sp.]
MNTKTKTLIKTAFASLALYGGVSMTTLGAAGIAHAAEPAIAVAMVETAQSGSFQKSSFNINGNWKIVKENGQTIFRVSEDFKTKNGPDLKLFLSRNNVDDATGATATQNAVRLGVLKSNKGSQDYIIPDNVDLAQFNSILIHCEAFSKLWGGANL